MLPRPLISEFSAQYATFVAVGLIGTTWLAWCEPYEIGGALEHIARGESAEKAIGLSVGGAESWRWVVELAARARESQP